MSNGIYINLTVALWTFGIALLICIISGLIWFLYGAYEIRGNKYE